MPSVFNFTQVKAVFARARHLVGKTKNRLAQVLSGNPFAAFFGLLAILLLVIVIGNHLRKPTTDTTPAATEPKLVNIYQSGQSPVMTLSGHVEESGIITIVAQTNGVVQKVNVTEGKHVTRSTNLVSMSATYNGGNPATVARQMDQAAAQFDNDNYDAQVDLLNRQRDLANKGDTQAAEMRDINRQSLDDTRHLIDLDTNIVDTLNNNINNLIATNVGGANDADILTTKQGLALATSGLNQLTLGLRTSEYASSDTTTPAQTDDAQRDLTLRQLDMKQKTLDLTKTIDNLKVKLDRINESMFYPVSPCAGQVQRVFVKVGQSVTAGTPIATIKADTRQLDIVVPVSVDLAKQVMTTEPSSLTINDHKISLTPRFVSTTPTEGALAAIFYTVPAEQTSQLEGQSNVTLQVPVGFSKAIDDQIYVPLDAVYQTQEKSYVYVIGAAGQGQIAQTKEIVLGTVSGQYVQVLSGLTTNDQVITDRGITDGQSVRTQ